MDEKHLYLAPAEETEGSLQPHRLSQMPCTVGRAGDCTLQLDFDRISRHHARFEIADQGLIVRDLDSTNGTFVNHQRINDPTPVQAGDSVHFADHGFVLQQRESGGSTMLPHRPSGKERATDTIIGFTALPTGFPVQAPEFFELLNDELVTGISEPIQTASGALFGHALRARSTHPKLAAESGTLFRLASDLGEEARLAQLIRETCLKQAASVGMQSLLFLEVHPAECEDLEFLVDELLGLAARYRHLALVCELPITALTDPSQLGQVRSKLAKRDIEICATQMPADKPDMLADCASQVDYLRCSSALGDSSISAFAGAMQGQARVLVDGISQAELVEDLAAAGASLFQGPALGMPQPIEG